MIASTMVFLPAVLLMTIIVHGQEPFDCIGYDDDSYHPILDADDCRHYWHCIYVNTVYMHAVKRVCPAGTEFHATLRQCETSSLVDCQPSKSPHLPRTTSTTKAWKWRYSRLFSQRRWKPTMPFGLTTRKHQIFDLGDAHETETTTTMAEPEAETTERILVLPVTLPQLTTSFSLEQLSKNLHALALNRRTQHHKPVRMRLFQIGEPDNEAENYASTTKKRTRQTRSTPLPTSIPITTQPFQTTVLPTTEAPIMTMTTAATTLLLTATTTTMLPLPLTSTAITAILTQPESTMDIIPQARINSRRNNMTLYILTSDEHKIRRFSVNHTRGILLNCNQLRRRLIGRRRLRNVLHTTTNHTLIGKHPSNTSIRLFHHTILLLIFSLTQIGVDT